MKKWVIAADEKKEFEIFFLQNNEMIQQRHHYLEPLKKCQMTKGRMENNYKAHLHIHLL
jgi:hypothetical protein